MRPPLHVTFGPSARGALIQAMARVGRPQPSVFLADNLCLGRLSSEEARAAWFWGIARDEEYAGWRAQEAEAWSRILDPDVTPIVWFSSLSAQEYLGLLHVLTRRSPSTIRIVDVATAGLTERDGRPWAPKSAGRVPTRQLAVLLAAESVAEVPAQVLEDLRVVWPRLVEEDASLRVMAPGVGLISAPISHFDEQLLALTPADTWKSWAWICGSVLSHDDNAWAAGELFLFERLEALEQQGVLESKDSGDPQRRWMFRRRGG